MSSLDRARILIKEDRHQQAYDLIVSDPANAETTEGQRLLGLACMRMKRYKEAMAFYESVCKKSTNSEDWFNLANARLLGGDAVHGIIALEEAKKRYLHGRESMSIEQMLFYFVGCLLDQSMWDYAKRYLQELSETYVKLGQTGDTYLYGHNIPYFSWFLNAAVTAYRSSNAAKAGVEWLTNLAVKLDPLSQVKITNAIRMLADR